jgi:ADP-dependent NAD(P)H-hydrate dehydratase / NAD(P)H-hydrate epimerase
LKNAMDLVTRDRMREMDRRTIEGGLVRGLSLMERAGRGILRSLVLRRPHLESRRICVVCGKGNNGGDGLVLARLLRDRGLWPRVLMTAPVASLRGDAAINAGRARDRGLFLEEDGFRARNRLASLSTDDLVVDALLGTGLRGPADAEAADWICAINESPAAVAAIDIPSGLSADSGRIEGAAIEAEWTVTMALPKLGFVFPPARELVGEVDVVDIGIPLSVRQEVGVEASLTTPEEVSRWLPRPGSGSHKGDWGKILIVGGSPGLIGAPCLAARAALRMGAGLVRIGVPCSLQPLVAGKMTEAMTILLPEGEEGQLLASGAERILSGFGDWDALVLGPGLGRFPEGDRLVMRLLGSWHGPILIDADGLNALAGWGPDSWVARAREVRAASKPGGVVLTPHLGEMSRLTGRPISVLREDPVGQAREWAQRWGVTLVLKGAPSVIASPEGEIRVNATGNSGLAKGGSGDVLSGIIGSLLGQGLTGPQAAALGCYLHGLAADLAVRAMARRSLLPSEVTEMLSQALRLVDEGTEPPSWRWRWV